jgi:hypothetical protein
MPECLSLVNPESVANFRTGLLRNLAMLAIATDEALRQYAGQRGIDEIRRDANLD